MKLKFKIQAYQTAAVQAVVDCFKGQPPASSEAISYRIDPVMPWVRRLAAQSAVVMVSKMPT